MEKQKIEINQEILKDILERDKNLQTKFVEALIEALSRERIHFVVHFSVSDFLRALEYTFRTEIREGIERAILKTLQKQT